MIVPSVSWCQFQAAKDLLPVDEHCRFAVRQEPEQVKERYSCIYAA